eukprot:m.78372 g.78372  ORF g.78372 m.78372 type:complete len:447 (-) comp25112_c0_seq1:147-1487(-)
MLSSRSRSTAIGLLLCLASTHGQNCNPELVKQRHTTPVPTELGKSVVAKLVKIAQPAGEEAVYPAALDGSPFAFYNGEVNPSTKWTINLQGGGWCYDEVDCLCRSQQNTSRSLGSSTGLNLVGHCSCANPLADGTFDACNCADLPYLDGASFSGYRAEPLSVPNSTEKIWMRGIKNIDGVLDYLFANTALKDATELVITGESAGGLATFLHADRIADRVRAGAPNCKKIVAQPIVGFFLDHDNFGHTNGFPGGPNSPQWSTPGTSANYTYWMKYIYTMQNLTFAEDGGLMADCQTNHPDHPYLCFMSPHMADVIKTPLFMLNSKYDAWQLENIFQSPWNTTAEEKGVLQYGVDFLTELDIVKQPGSPHGGAICSCICHGCPWPFMPIGGKVATQHYADWFYGVTKGGVDSFHIDPETPNHGGTYTNSSYRLCKPYQLPPSIAIATL